MNDKISSEEEVSLRLHLHDFRYIHEDGRERLGITPPKGTRDGWRRQTRDVYVTEWRDTDLPWPELVSMDFTRSPTPEGDDKP
jgi:hypothetical protein